MNLSPKVSIPTILGVIVGVVLLLAGEHTVGVAVLLSAIGYGGVGAAAPPAPGVSQAEVASISRRRR